MRVGDNDEKLSPVRSGRMDDEIQFTSKEEAGLGKDPEI